LNGYHIVSGCPRPHGSIILINLSPASPNIGGRVPLLTLLIRFKQEGVLANIVENLLPLEGFFFPFENVIIWLFVLESFEDGLVLHRYFQQFSLSYVFVQTFLLQRRGEHGRLNYPGRLHSESRLVRRICRGGHYVRHFLQQNAVFSLYFCVPV
jgi:hypothetical protein